jgi:fructose transport system ATP-binding protein
VVLISHNMPHVFEVADRIHVARLGSGPPAEPEEDQHERHRRRDDRRAAPDRIPAECSAH